MFKASKSSQIFLRRSGNSRAKDGARDRLIDLVERAHRTFDPVLIDLCREISETISLRFGFSATTYFHHELPDGLLCLLAVGIAGQEQALSSRRCTGWWRGLICRIWCRCRIRIHEKHEFDVAAGEEAVDVVVLIRVYSLQIPVEVISCGRV